MSVHVRQRALERYGLDLSHGDVAMLGGAARERRGVLLCARSLDGCERWLLQLRGVALVAVYSRASGNVVTVLPRSHGLTGRVGEKFGKRRARRGGAWESGRRAPPPEMEDAAE